MRVQGFIFVIGVGVIVFLIDEIIIDWFTERLTILDSACMDGDFRRNRLSNSTSYVLFIVLIKTYFFDFFFFPVLALLFQVLAAAFIASLYEPPIFLYVAFTCAIHAPAIVVFYNVHFIKTADDFLDRICS